MAIQHDSSVVRTLEKPSAQLDTKASTPPDFVLENHHKGVTYCRHRRKYKAQAHVRIDFKCYKVLNLGYSLTLAGAIRLYKQFQSEKAEAR